MPGPTGGTPQRNQVGLVDVLLARNVVFQLPSARGGIIGPSGHNITSFCGSSCANNGKDALNTPSGHNIYIYI
eukprot:1191168-Prorocentrum_minimum.AAC.3